MEIKKEWYKIPLEEIESLLQTSLTHGLNKEQIELRQEKYGKNVLVNLHKQSEIMRFLSQFHDSFMYLLMISASIAMYLDDINTAIILAIIILINVIIGYIQEAKAENTMEKLKNLMTPRAEVIRDGKRMEINSSDLVPGDIVFLEEGDAVPADLRLFDISDLGENDFSLTGESNPVKKFTYALKQNAEIGDRNNIAFMGTTIATGTGWGIVVAIGMMTELGRITQLSTASEHDISPLQKEMRDISIKTIIIVLILVLFFVAITLYLKFSLYEAFLFALGIGAAMVPQGLPTQLNVGLSLASSRLAKKNTIVKKLSSVETLGATNIICTDKTGTLTKNEMTVQKLFLGNSVLSVKGIGYQPNGEIIKEDGTEFDEEDLIKNIKFFEAGMFASNARVNPPDSDHKTWYVLGDPTEGALISLSQKMGFDQKVMNMKHKEIKEFGFDSERKRMSSVRKIDNKYYAFVKGAPESIMEISTKFWDGKTERTIMDEDKAMIKHYDNERAKNAMRVLAYGYKEITNYNEGIHIEECESEMIFLGLVGMIDPPREEVLEAMSAAHSAHIKVIMITGDYALTGEAIAKKIGLAPKHETFKIINGTEIKTMSDEQLKEVLMSSYLLFARSSPEDKLRIVKLLKSKYNVIAVTGDGINDAPALKEADIGVAMGMVGTDVAKEAAEMILLNDSFGTLIFAIKEGRTIYQNIKKNILACFTTNYTELSLILFSLAMNGIAGWPLAITAIQILAIDLIGEMLPLTAMTWDSPQKNIMVEKPRNINDHIFTRSRILDFVWAGTFMGMIAFGAFFLRHIIFGIQIGDSNGLFYQSATTLTYVTIVLCQYMNIMSFRAGPTEYMFTSYFRENKKMFMAIGISLFFILNLVYNPRINRYFGFASLQGIDWIIGIGGMLIYGAVREGYKFFAIRKMEREEEKNVALSVTI